ncbi:GyrI-like domain-containing protein [Tissierella pigra]|uniref:GyrI-like domain-containing protein n=1 Tax=Tissierella pigra TaxID=2607614 RepID=A0A6N7XXB0_9FIRM|nr:GyrI-like domain-containing protein [Tissierella pigra]MBU5425546.1 GyrI-like domain-containing protein [Tissierella pigra]MSU00898.1 GyrI-like domain-containing protein [Tissierella pigra]
MKFRIISLPAFKAASSGVDKNFDFSPSGILGKFNDYFSIIKPSDRDSFLPRDFLCFDEEKQGLIWIFALSEDIDSGGNEVIDFDGGLYLTYAYKDGDDDIRTKLYNEALKYIEESEVFELDIRPNHYSMGHIITPPEVIEAQGWAQMEAFIPIKLKDN